MEKMNKQQLINLLKGAKIKDKGLATEVKEALATFAKDQTKVLKATLLELANKVQATQATPVEASLKPKAKKETPKKVEAEPVEEEPVEEVVEEKPKKKTSLKKGGSKKAEEPKQAVETLAPATNVGADYLPSAKIFPAEIDHPELGKIISCHGAYTTYAEVLKALEEDKTLYFCSYWTKRQLKEFRYAEAKMIDPKLTKNGFPNDLDILMAVLPCETIERVFAMSRITEALFQFEGIDFEYIEDTDLNGNKFTVRVSAGMEFEIYRPADEEITE